MTQQTERRMAERALGAATLKVVRQEPLNAESPLAQQLGVLTPVERFYVRSHFPIVADADPAAWRLEVSGAVDRPFALGLAELLEMPTRSLAATLECAGNGRAMLQPAVPGEQWEFGAVSTAEWTGVPLSALLERAGVAADAVEVEFEGADRGASPLDGGEVAYQRSLPLAEARRADILVAYAMNGAPLTAQHGAPLRLVVPGWYGMASVKWLRQIRARREPLHAAFQTGRYVYRQREGDAGSPVSAMRVRALITSPAAGDRLAAGGVPVRGYAWSGAAEVSAVDVSADGGATWRPAELAPAASPRAWRSWQFRWTPAGPGAYALLARARDASGAVQPLEPDWNMLGYGNNAVQRVAVEVNS